MKTSTKNSEMPISRLVERALPRANALELTSAFRTFHSLAVAQKSSDKKWVSGLKRAMEIAKEEKTAEGIRKKVAEEEL